MPHMRRITMTSPGLSGRISSLMLIETFPSRKNKIHNSCARGCPHHNNDCLPTYHYSNKFQNLWTAYTVGDWNVLCRFFHRLLRSAEKTGAGWWSTDVRSLTSDLYFTRKPQVLQCTQQIKPIGFFNQPIYNKGIKTTRFKTTRF